MVDLNKIRSDFPVLAEEVYGQPLVYFDNGATTQKPEVVIKAVSEAYSVYYSNIHRGVHALSDKSSEKYESAREKVKSFINATKKEEIIFTAGTTASINLVAFSFGEKYISAGDEVLISGMEHHANIVPWQMMCERKNARLRVIPLDDDGSLQITELDGLINPKTKIIAITQVSNATGVTVPVKEVIRKAHDHDIPVLVDGAQGIQHGHVDVQELDCDFYAFSGHKVYGPTGIGVLYGKEKWLDELPPWQGGGDMVDRVTFDKTTYNELPFKFEAGTMNFVGAIGLAEALSYIETVGMEDIIRQETELTAYTNKRIREIDGITLYGNTKDKISILSFLIDNVHQYDAGMILDKMGVAVRTGSHCAQPLMDRFGIDGTIRASMCFYNTTEEVDILIEGIKKVKAMML
ncbi:MAG: cysteine desulfurase [Bacteroidales bacterium]|nr:cysteine desulfurase [Bacteroidales bacterium]